MTMSKRKRRREIRDHAAARRFYLIVGIATVMLIMILFLVYKSVN